MCSEEHVVHKPLSRFSPSLWLPWGPIPGRQHLRRRMGSSRGLPTRCCQERHLHEAAFGILLDDPIRRPEFKDAKLAPAHVCTEQGLKLQVQIQMGQVLQLQHEGQRRWRKELGGAWSKPASRRWRQLHKFEAPLHAGASCVLPRSVARFPVGGCWCCDVDAPGNGDYENILTVPERSRNTDLLGRCAGMA